MIFLFILTWSIFAYVNHANVALSSKVYFGKILQCFWKHRNFRGIVLNTKITKTINYYHYSLFLLIKHWYYHKI